MFSGIIQSQGMIVDICNTEDNHQYAGKRLRIHAPNFPLNQTKLGDSIAINGACMTVVSFDQSHFEVDVSFESLSKTCGLDGLGPVNLEPALRMGDALDGHIVSGHVDGVGRITELKPVAESYFMQVQVPVEFAPYMAYKGSVTIDGVSLTVNQVHDNADGCLIEMNLIPHTFAVTTFKHNKVGDLVNLEIDTMARYVARYVQRWQEYSH